MPGRKLVKKSAKEEVVKDLAEKFKASQAVIFTEYRGLSVAQVTRLRSELKDCDYIVAKNTLARIAAKEAGMNGVDDQLTGPSAKVVMGENYVENARILRDFSKSEPKLKVKGGYVDGSVMSVEEVKQLADLKTRPEVLSMFAGAMKASIGKLARVLVAVPTKAVRTVDALGEKKSET